MIFGKVVHLGNSAAITIEKKVIRENHLRFGQRVGMVLLTPVARRKKLAALKKMFGFAKGAGPLEDDYED